jgi:rubrerythrin
MTIRDLRTRLHFQALLLLPFGVALLLLALFGSACSEKPKEAAVVKPTITLENLQTAHDKSIRRMKMYTLFVEQALKEKNKQLALLYTAIARSESIHAVNHARLLKANGIDPIIPAEEKVVVGTVVQTLKMATNSEELEYDRMYPNMAKTAELEKVPEAVTQFEQTEEADARHAELLKEVSDHAGKTPKVPYFVCPGCGYIMTSEKTEECPVCKKALDRATRI